MTQTVLSNGDEIRCPYCRQWHPVTQPYREGTAYTQAMLLFVCRQQTYYAGQRGLPCRHPTRRRRAALS